MGVDYFHGVYANPSTCGDLQTAQRVEDVLRSHRLIGEATGRWRLDNDNVRSIEAGEIPADARNVGFSFASSHTEEHSLAVTKCLLGGHDAGELDAWADFFIVSGPDYRLMPEGEYGPGVRVLEPPMVSGEELSSHSPERPSDAGSAWPHMAFGALCFDASTGCTPPVCELDWFEPILDGRTGEPLNERPADGFTGLWRTALLIQSKPHGWKDESGYGTYLRLVLPETEFKTDLWSALGGSAHEMGTTW